MARNLGGEERGVLGVGLQRRKAVPETPEEKRRTGGQDPLKRALPKRKHHLRGGNASEKTDRGLLSRKKNFGGVCFFVWGFEVKCGL